MSEGLSGDEPLVVSLAGITITTADVAVYLALAGAMPRDMFEYVTEKIEGDELERYTVAYDKARIIYNEALGELND